MAGDYNTMLKYFDGSVPGAGSSNMTWGGKEREAGFYYSLDTKNIYEIEGQLIYLVGKMNPNGKFKCTKDKKYLSVIYDNYGVTEFDNTSNFERDKKIKAQSPIEFFKKVDNGRLEYLGKYLKFEPGSGLMDYYNGVLNCKISGGSKKRRVTGSATRRSRVKRVLHARRLKRFRSKHSRR